MTSVGKVYLVGAGPGDPGLISQRGIECLRLADVVLYDGLVNPLLLEHSHAATERTCRVGEAAGKRLDQAEINRRLVEAALAGQTVVRLKGGDPYIFGRGSEEAAALREAGIPFEVVPGVTAAVAAAEYAGISLTHRDFASAVAFVTGHEDPTKAETSLDYAALAAFPGTLVFYMGLHRLPQIAASLMQQGKPSQTPACVISRGTWTLQRTVTAPLGEIADAVRAADLHAPSLIVVGECVQMREQLAWFEDRPLFGRKIAITRPLPQAYETARRAFAWGAHPVLLPTIGIAPPESWEAVDNAIDRIDTFDWLIFTSTNGVQSFLDRFFARGYDARRLASVQIAAIGSSTAACLQEYHLQADIVPEAYRAEALAAALQDQVAGRRVLWARASRGRDVLPTSLRAAGAEVEEVVVYRNEDAETLPADALEQLRNRGVDWIGLSSPSIARNLARLLPDDIRGLLGGAIRLAALSPVTGDAAREAGLPVSVEAETYTWEGLFEAIAAAEAGQG